METTTNEELVSIEEANKIIAQDNDLVETTLKQTETALTTISENITKITNYLNSKHQEIQNPKAKNYTLKLLTNLLKVQKTINNTKDIILTETSKANTKIYQPLYQLPETPK
jgi:cob(I)alamin adenosyltransferase